MANFKREIQDSEGVPACECHWLALRATIADGTKICQLIYLDSFGPSEKWLRNGA